MSSDPPPRLLLIGWDAADWRFIDPLIAAGLMPTLAALRDRAAWGNLATLRPVLSPMLWTSIATGKRAAKHGILGFVEPTPDGQGVQPVTSRSRRCKALWNIADQNGLRSNVVGWYATHPAESIEHGVIVSNQFEIPTTTRHDHWPASLGAVHPPDLAGSLCGLRVHPTEIGSAAVLPFVPEAAMVDQSRDPRLARLRQLIAQTASIHALATHLMEQREWNLTCVYYEAIDRFGHEFMPFHPPKMSGVSDAEFQLYNQVMTGCYRWFDMMLERLLALAGPGTNVMLVSDHGYRHDARRPAIDADPETWHRGHGVALVAGPGITTDPRHRRLFGATVLDVAPTALALLGLPAARDMDGRVWAEILATAPPLPVESWEDDHARSPEPATIEDAASQRAAVGQLIQLGYLDASAAQGIDAAARAAELARHNLAISLLDAGDPASAAAAAELLAGLAGRHPDSPELSVQHAVALATAGRRDEARSIADSIGARPDPPARLHLLLASLDVADGRVDSAVARLARFERSDAARPELLVRKAQIYFAARRFAEAGEAFARAVELDPDLPLAHDGLSACAIARGDWSAAVGHALDATALAHFLPRAHLHLATALAALGKTEEARAAARLAVHQAPTLAEARELLARLQAGQ